MNDLIQCNAIDFSNETSWGGVLELFRSNKQIVSLNVPPVTYFTRLDYLYFESCTVFDVPRLICMFFMTLKDPQKTYINFIKFREIVADACLSAMMIDNNPYGVLEWLTDSCHDVGLYDSEYCITHNDKLYVFKRTDLLLHILEDSDSDRFKIFIKFIENILPNEEAQCSNYLNMEYLNLMFDIMPFEDIN